MKVGAANFHEYFLNCYQADNKTFTIDNILSAKYKYKWFGKGRENLINDNYPKIPYNNSKIDNLEKELELYKLEKSLFYASFFLVGKNDNPLVKDSRICAPLLLYPADISHKDGQSYISIRKEELLVNKGVLSFLTPKNTNYNKVDFLNRLYEAALDITDNALKIKSLFDETFSNITADDLGLFPTLEKINTVKKQHETLEDIFRIISASGTVLIEKSTSSLRVAHDLESIIKSKQFNRSLRSLLFNEQVTSRPKSSNFQFRLNPEQYQVLKNSHRFTNTVLIGPPGTGKSYTIANIIADAVARDRSVLVVSKTKQAVEVIREMLWMDFGLRDNIVHTSGRQYKSSLKGKLRRHLTGIKKRRSPKLNSIKLDELVDQMKRYQAEFESMVGKEITLNQLRDKDNLTLHEKWQKLLINWTGKLDERLWRVYLNIQETSIALQKELVKYSRHELDHRTLTLNNDTRQEISSYYDGLSQTSFTEYKNALSQVNFSKILEVLPVWLADLSQLNGVIPLEKEVFNLVIIDEATQCDIASALPAIYRAKKVLIAGDPNQLKHYSFISRAYQNSLKSKFKIPEDKFFDYRERSILDVFISKVTNQEQVVFLREHFRSTPSLIQFSNQNFYHNQLEIIKSTPNHIDGRHLKLVNVKGLRNENGVNEIEALAVLDQLDKFISDFEPLSTPPSIGIIGMLSDQSNFIKTLIRSRYDLTTIKRFKLLCGTPYHFQGTEREIILLSLGITNECHHSALRHISTPEVLNVGVTRARSQQYVFSSIASPSKINGLLGEYLSFIQSFNYVSESELSEDEFQTDVIAELNNLDVQKIYKGYPVAGSILDILVEHNNQNHFIDLIGFPGIYQEAFPVERYRTLVRANIKCLPLHYSFWIKQREKTISQLKSFLGITNN